jgi:hypothetical protein
MAEDVKWKAPCCLWQPADVATLADEEEVEVTVEEKLEILERARKSLEEGMTAAGWEILRTVFEEWRREVKR